MALSRRSTVSKEGETNEYQGISRCNYKVRAARKEVCGTFIVALVRSHIKRHVPYFIPIPKLSVTYLVFRADLHLQVQIYDRLFNLVLVAVLSARSLVTRGRRSVVVATGRVVVTAVDWRWCWWQWFCWCG